MRVAVMSGNQPRHLVLAGLLQKVGLLAGEIVETKAKYSIDFSTVDGQLRRTVEKHFRLRDEAEEIFFGTEVAADAPRLEVGKNELTDVEAQSFLKRLKPDLVIIWGTSLVSDEFMEGVGAHFWNIHAGLSPDYKGAATMFWPSYFAEPQMTGVTLHIPVSRIDAGPIIHQIGAQLTPGDGLQMHSARALRKAIEEIVTLLVGLGGRDFPRGIRQRRTGKLFAEADWRPDHLRLIYETFNDQIVDRALEGQLVGRLPALISHLPSSE